VTPAQGETAVTTSALVVTGLYAYRKATETITKAPSGHNVGAPLKGGLKGYVEAPLGLGELAPLGEWATGMGVTFIFLSIAASVNSTFGGSFAILVAVGAVLTNGQAVLQDIGHGLGSSTTPSKGTAAPEKPEGRKAREGMEPLLVASNHPPVK
jgi:hypothetical protein